MTIKPHILTHLVEQFEQKRNIQLTSHRRALRITEREARTLDTLEQFRDERINQRRNRAQPGTSQMTAEQQSHESRFDARLTSAIRTQTEKLADTTRQSEQTAATFREAQRRLTAISILQDRQEQRARLARQKADQKHNDELASQRRGPNTPNRSS